MSSMIKALGSPQKNQRNGLGMYFFVVGFSVLVESSSLIGSQGERVLT